MSLLFTPLRLREVEFRNRVFVSPMCQYSCTDGVVSDWHLVHLGSRAVGGAGMVMTEAAAVSPEGRISPQDAGIWNDAQQAAFSRIARFIREQGAVPAMQLAHAGRKASTRRPWEGNGAVPVSEGGWEVLSPSAIAFSESYPLPREMTKTEIDAVVDDFVAAAARAFAAGFEVIELHMAHGYLLHEFLSPVANQRRDAYGGTLENRMRLPLQVAAAVRDTWPAHLPLMVRISASDWVAGGWDIEQSVVLSQRLKALGVDMMDVSSGGLSPEQVIPVGAGYQVAFADKIRKSADLPVAAVGLITEAMQAEQILRTGQADAVMLARQLLRDPYWPMHAARTLHAEIKWPPQYERAK